MMFNKEWTFANALCVVFAVILIFVIIVTIDIINIMIKKKFNKKPFAHALLFIACLCRTNSEHLTMR